jgi:acyl-[acyl-carrier-protein]-phospholipid O-acyltransferase/long-chain-fatty-acid--[acyl-carrier-protein] ligase
MSNTVLSLLRVRRFLPLFLTQFFGALNDSLFKNAVFILITYSLASEASAEQWVTLGGALFILPSFLFSATAGHIADRFDKSTVARYSKCLECIIMILAAIGFCYSNFYLLLLALFLIGAQAAFFGPVKYAILPDHLYKNELIPGTALIEASTFLAILIGTLLGGLFIGIPHGTEVVSFLILLAAILGLSTSFAIPKATVTQVGTPLSWNIIQETIKVIRYALQQPRIYFTIMGISWFWLVGATFLMLLALFTKNILHASSTVVTLFLSLFSVGIGIGSYLCTRIQKGRIDTHSVPWAMMAVTVFIVDLFFASSTGVDKSGELLHFTAFFHTLAHWRISLDFLGIAICSGIYIVPLYTLLQTQSEPTHRARVIATNNIFNALFMVLSSIASMLLLGLGLSVLHLFLLLGIANAVVAIILKAKL